MNPALGAPARKLRVRVTSVILAGAELLVLPPALSPLEPPEELDAQDVRARAAVARRVPARGASRGFFAGLLWRRMCFLSFLGVVMGSMAGALPGRHEPLDQL